MQGLLLKHSQGSILPDPASAPRNVSSHQSRQVIKLPGPPGGGRLNIPDSHTSLHWTYFSMIPNFHPLWPFRRQLRLIWFSSLRRGRIVWRSISHPRPPPCTRTNRAPLTGFDSKLLKMFVTNAFH